MRNIAYRRTSTTHQTFDRQLVDIAINFDKEFSDQLSGKDTNRPAFQECLSYLQEGDTLWVHEISRLSRSVVDLRNTVSLLVDKGVSVKFVKEGLEFSAGKESGMAASMTKLLLNLLGSISEFERDLINSRTQEGVNIAKKKGKKFGGSSEKWQKSYQENKAKGLHKQRSTSVSAKLHKEPVVAAITKMMNYSGDSLKLSEISANLTQEGFTTPRGKEYSPAAISRLMKENNIVYRKKNTK